MWQLLTVGCWFYDNFMPCASSPAVEEWCRKQEAIAVYSSVHCVVCLFKVSEYFVHPRCLAPFMHCAVS